MSEKLAKKFHEIYEQLAPNFGYETRTDTREFDPTIWEAAIKMARAHNCEAIASQLEQYFKHYEMETN